MKCKIDENLPQEVAEILRAAGNDAETVAEERMSGSDDSSVAAAANSEQRTLITLDTDFANITAYPPSQHHGIIVIRAGAQDKRTICDLVTHLVPILTARDPAQELWILEPGRIRVRR
ncbi:MAG: DUF5615 family PIN-like protein [Acidobacteria bacterium]|nr:DUF5615 family PIN-like protein [Acidobacteriota bacterium]